MVSSSVLPAALIALIRSETNPVPWPAAGLASLAFQLSSPSLLTVAACQVTPSSSENSTELTVTGRGPGSVTTAGPSSAWPGAPTTRHRPVPAATDPAADRHRVADPAPPAWC